MKPGKGMMRFFLIAFFLVILFPLWGCLFSRPEASPPEENQAAAEWSSSGSLRDRIGRLADDFSDHLAFRRSVNYAVLHANLLLGESPHPLVVPGTDGWLFYVTGTEDFRTGVIVEPDSLRDLYEAQQATADTLAAAGVDYRVLIVPDKSTVYFQYLPLNRRLGEEMTMMDQMVKAPGAKYSFRFTDVRGALIYASQEGLQQYYRTDANWNSNGAWSAYQVLIDSLLKDHPSIRRLTREDLEQSIETYSGDLADMIGQRGIITETFACLSIRDTTSAEKKNDESGFTAYVNDAIPDAPSLLFIGDSFGDALLPYLRESFSKVCVLSNDGVSIASLGDLSRFDILVYELVERNRARLWNGIPDSDPAADGAGKATED